MVLIADHQTIATGNRTMADDLWMALIELMCKAELVPDACFLVDNVSVLSRALKELDVGQHLKGALISRIASIYPLGPY